MELLHDGDQALWYSQENFWQQKAEPIQRIQLQSELLANFSTPDPPATIELSKNNAMKHPRFVVKWWLGEPMFVRLNPPAEHEAGPTFQDLSVVSQSLLPLFVKPCKLARS